VQTDRILAPDLARGAMLLFIALANAANSAFAGQPGLDPTPHGLDRVLNLLLATFVDSRAYPVFAIMFGYGLVQLSRRRGPGDLLRRNAFLVAFGAVHGVLLYFGDFLGAYGIVGIVATLFLLPRGDRFHRFAPWVWAGSLCYVVVLGALLVTGSRGGDALLVNTPNPSLAAPSYPDAVLDRLGEWPAHTATVVPFIVIVWLGIWAARKRILDDPGAHRVLLRRAAVGCLAVAFAGGLPYGLVAAGWLHVDASTVETMARLHAASGGFGGPGYIALFGLLASRMSTVERSRALSGKVPLLVGALGRRSLSGYLFQSLAWTALFAPWALDLGGSTSVAIAAAVSVWALSVLAAFRMERRQRRGPAETLLRRLAYTS
jgi:uncharacterized protein